MAKCRQHSGFLDAKWCVPSVILCKTCWVQVNDPAGKFSFEHPQFCWAVNQFETTPRGELGAFYQAGEQVAFLKFNRVFELAVLLGKELPNWSCAHKYKMYVPTETGILAVCLESGNTRNLGFLVSDIELAAAGDDCLVLYSQGWVYFFGPGDLERKFYHPGVKSIALMDGSIVLGFTNEVVVCAPEGGRAGSVHGIDPIYLAANDDHLAIFDGHTRAILVYNVTTGELLLNMKVSGRILNLKAWGRTFAVMREDYCVQVSFFECFSVFDCFLPCAGDHFWRGEPRRGKR